MGTKDDLQRSMEDSMDQAATLQAEALRGAASGLPDPIVQDILDTAEKHTNHAARVAEVLDELPDDG